MKTQFLPLLIFALLCFQSQAQETESRDLPFFNKINYEGKGSLFLEYSDQPSIKIQNSETHEAIHVRTEVIEETLYIWYDFESANEGPFDHQQIDIFLYYPELVALNINGQVRVDAIQPIMGDSFELIAEGKIDMRLPLQVREFNAKMEGSMSTIFSGQVEKETIEFEGRGSVNALELRAGSAKVTTNGLGSLYMPYIESLNAVATGLSEIIYQKSAACKATNKGVGVIRSNCAKAERKM